MPHFHSIGSANTPWTDEDKTKWFSGIVKKRDYKIEVVNKLAKLGRFVDIEQYGSLTISPEQLPLFYAKSKQWQPEKPTILITGGVHGYETSGVHGALLFIETELHDYQSDFNFIIVPCVSPWGYETINRWNPKAQDPNRSFYAESACEESLALMNLVAQQNTSFLAHFDLHETTDSDETEFRPALAARDGVDYEPGMIPDGYYTVDDTENPNPDFQSAIINSVRQVTHIAPSDNNGEIIGAKVVQEGVIQYPLNALHLCASVTDARYTTTTEVYPDSALVNDELCNRAQVAAIKGGLDYLLNLSR